MGNYEANFKKQISDTIRNMFFHHDYNIAKKENIAEITARLQVKKWFDTASFEMSASETDKLEKLSRLLPTGSKISVVNLPNKPVVTGLNFIKGIVDNGFVPVPHIAARNIKDHHDLKRILIGLQKCGVVEVLLIGGGLNEQQGTFKTVMDMLRTGYFEEYGIRKFAIAGFPEKHPYASDEEIYAGYEEKYQYFTERALDFYMITQFTFSSDNLVNFALNLSGKNLRFPVQIGVVGVCNFQQLIKYSITCGIGNSLKVLKKEAGNVANMIKGYKSELFLNPLAEKLADNTDLHQILTGIHVFTFGNIVNTHEYFENYQ